MIIHDVVPRRSVRPFQMGLLLLAVGCSHALRSQTTARTTAQANKAAPALMLAPLAGQSIPLLPVTYLLAADSVSGLPSDHAAQLKWADSILGAQFTIRGPEVTWVFPEALRQVARRAPGTVIDPEKMGQSMLRSPGLKRVPDQLLTNLRPLMALANARYLMAPASLLFTRSATGVSVTVTLVLIDARAGEILWHSEPTGAGPNAASALTAIFARILP